MEIKSRDDLTHVSTQRQPEGVCMVVTDSHTTMAAGRAYFTLL